MRSSSVLGDSGIPGLTPISSLGYPDLPSIIHSCHSEPWTDEIRLVSGFGLVFICEMLKKFQHDWGIAGLCICDYEDLTFLYIKYILKVYMGGKT